VTAAIASDRLHSERRLGFRLSFPAFFVMILVTAYPLGYAVVLSLYHYRLTDPSGKEFVGLSNYVTVLTDPVWWSAVSTTAIITLVSVGVELVPLVERFAVDRSHGGASGEQGTHQMATDEATATCN